MTVPGAVAARARGLASRWIDGHGSLRSLVPLRVAIGPLVFLHLRPFLEDAAEGRIYRDAFYQPYVAWYPELPRSLYVGLLWATVAAAGMVSIGLATRAASVATAGGVAYNLFLSETHFHHNRAFLLILLIGVATMPLGRWVSIDARRRPHVPPEAPLWPLALLRFEVSVAYWASGLSKLLDGDWWGGVVTRLRVEQYRDVAAAGGVPDWLLDVVSTEGFHWWFAKAVVLTELTIGIGLFWRRSRLVAIWLAIGFHISVEMTAEVQVFGVAALAALVIWVTPTARDRILTLRTDRAASRLLAAAVAAGDWTGRFRLHRALEGPAVRLDDRPGPDEKPVTRTGTDAAVMTLSRLPVTFWPAAPLLAVRRLRRRERGDAPGR